jgi:hypothetical protein
MRRVQGRRLSAAEKADLWARWRRGESPMDIARALERGYLAVRGVVAAVGGIPPAARRRSRLALTIAEREEISRGLAHGGRCGSWLERWDARPRRLAAKSGAMAADADIARRPQTRGRGRGVDARSAVAWRRGRRCAPPSPPR